MSYFLQPVLFSASTNTHTGAGQHAAAPAPAAASVALAQIAGNAQQAVAAPQPFPHHAAVLPSQIPDAVAPLPLEAAAAAAAPETPPPNIASLRNLTTNIQLLAPNSDRAVPCTISGTVYLIWWNEAIKAVNIQKEVDFRAHSQLNKLGIKLNRADLGRYDCFVNGTQSQQGIPQDFRPIIPEIITHIEELRTQYNEIERLKNKFDPQCLRLLLNFLKSPQGANYRYSAGTQTQSSKQLSIGSDPEILAWMRVEAGQAQYRRGDSQAGAPRPGQYIVNLQTRDSYRYILASDKLGIKIDDSGRILSVYQDGAPVAAGQIEDVVFGPEGVWNKRLTCGMLQFLTTKAMTITGSHIDLHPLVLNHQPEAILTWLASLLPALPHVGFLTDHLVRGPGVDAGGPRRQFFSDFFMNLLDGSESRLIHINPEKMPTLSEEPTEAEHQALRNLGRVLAFCGMSHQAFITGRVLPDDFFKIVQILYRLPPDQPIPENIFFGLCRTIATDEQRKLHEIHEGRRAPTAQEMNTLVNILCIVSQGDSPDTIKQAVGEYLREAYSQPAYRNTIQAAHEIVLGMHSVESAECESLIQLLPPAQISEQIQGMVFSRPDIARRVMCSSTNPVVSQKAQWIRDFILDQTVPQKEVERLLFTITGERVITANTRIEINEGEGQNCVAHTCFQTLSVPITHVTIGTHPGVVTTDQQKFYNNLRITMAQSQFDIS
jgi:hypothetical protein